MHKLTREAVLRKKALSPLEDITFNWKQSNIFLVRADFLRLDALCPAVTTFFSGQANSYRMRTCVDRQKKHSKLFK